MKKSLLILAMALFATGTLISGCQSSAKNVEDAESNLQDAKANVADARQDLKEARKDSISAYQQFRKDAEVKIDANEQKIAELKVKIANENAENRARYEKRVAVLEQRNREMRRNLDEFREDGKENWQAFKVRFDHDMDAFGAAFKGFWVRDK